MDKNDLEKFLFKARTKTYAGNGGKVKALLEGTVQLEYEEGEWFYRDVYYNGKNGFMGLEGILYKGKPVFSVSYYGTYNGLTEDEADRILRKALIENPETRGYKNVEWKHDDYTYICEPDITEGIKEIAGAERIIRGTSEIYAFYYGGQVL